MPWPAELIIDFNSTGENVVIPAESGELIEVWQLFFTVDAATFITVRNGVGGTDLTPRLTFLTGGALVFDPVGDDRDPTRPWFTTDTSAAFVLHQTGTAQVSGRIYYTQRRP